MQPVIKTEMESFFKGIRDEISALRETTKADIKTTREEFTEKVERLFSLQAEAADTQMGKEQSLNLTPLTGSQHWRIRARNSPLTIRNYKKSAPI